MNEIVKVYKNSPVRIVERGGEPWFVAKDVCKVLEITKVDSAIRNLDADEKGLLQNLIRYATASFSFESR